MKPRYQFWMTDQQIYKMEEDYYWFRNPPPKPKPKQREGSGLCGVVMIVSLFVWLWVLLHS
jgi:hypothetical protein